MIIITFMINRYVPSNEELKEILDDESLSDNDLDFHYNQISYFRIFKDGSLVLTYFIVLYISLSSNFL